MCGEGGQLKERSPSSGAYTSSRYNDYQGLRGLASEERRILGNSDGDDDDVISQLTRSRVCMWLSI